MADTKKQLPSQTVIEAKRLSDAEIDRFAELLFLLKEARAHYHCVRPPRASGAMILTKYETTVKAGVEAPEGSPSCDTVGCDIVDGHCVRCIHAEQAVIAAAARSAIPTDNAIMYSINKPCHNCTKLIIAAGIKTIIYVYTVYDEDRTNEIIKDAYIDMVHVSEERLLEIAHTIQRTGTKTGLDDAEIESLESMFKGLSEGLTS